MSDFAKDCKGRWHVVDVAWVTGIADMKCGKAYRATHFASHAGGADKLHECLSYKPKRCRTCFRAPRATREEDK